MKLPVVITLCLLLAVLSATARAAAFQDKENVWQAVVKAETAALYSNVSASSRMVKLLTRGDVVTINLEITKDDGKWYSVTLPGQTTGAGYMSGKDLEVGQQSNLAIWEYTPPPEPVAEPEKTDPAKKSSPNKAAFFETSGKVRIDVKSFVKSKFGNSLPISAFGQTALHNHMGFDHRNAVDVALSPDSLQGQRLVNELRRYGVPFIAFRRAVRGSATGPHIHVGMPSHRVRKAPRRK